jgi:L-lactate dehydrogenase
MPERRKVSIVGAGSVGATIAYASLIRGAPKTVALHDIDRDKVRAEVLDLNQGSQFYPAANPTSSSSRRGPSRSRGRRGWSSRP